MYTSLPRGVPRCHHVRINGTRCDSPALKGKPYCYFHFRSRLSHPPVSPQASSQEPIAIPAEGLQPRTDGLPPLSPPPDLFLLEDANSIQSALQWVLRRILAASIDRRQASLLLYGLQIAAANVKQTTFEPYYKKIIRDLPAAETAITESSENAHEPAQNCLDCAPEPGAFQRTGSNNTSHPEVGPGEPSPVRANGPVLSSPNEQPIPVAPPQPPLQAQLATGNCQLATAPPKPPTAPIRRNRKPRRPRPASIDTRMLSSTPRAALSLMFQREIKRHLARHDFPNSPDADAAES
jgi:hypothetical protein